MDVSNAKKLSERIARFSRSNDIELYNEANENGMTVSQLLEKYDPSEKDGNGVVKSPLDAFGRQMMLSNIKMGNGYGNSVSVEQLIDGPAGVLTAEFIRREIKKGMDSIDGVNDLIAVSTSVEGNSFHPIYITEPEKKGKSLSKVSRGSEMPKVTVLYREKSIPVSDYGRGLDIDYKVLKYMSLVEFRVILWYIGVNISEDKIASVYNTIVTGDGTSTAAESVSSAVSGYQNVTYNDLISLLMAFPKPFKMNRMIVSKNVLARILTLSEFKDPMAGFRFQSTGEVMTPFGARLIRYDGGSDDKIAALDKKFAVKEGIESLLTIEVDKVIQRKLGEAAVWESNGYATIAEDARKILDMS